MNTASAVQLIETICRAVPAERRQSAKTFHDAVDFALVQRGWTVYREQEAPSHGLRRRGLIDLVTTAPLLVGIELDNRAPRQKSLLKLREFDGVKIIVLRNAPARTERQGDVTIIGIGSGRPASAG